MMLRGIELAAKNVRLAEERLAQLTVQSIELEEAILNAKANLRAEQAIYKQHLEDRLPKPDSIPGQ